MKTAADACRRWCSAGGDNGRMARFEGLLVVCAVGLVLCVTIRALLSRQSQGQPAIGTGHWRTTHYDVHGHTRVVVQKVAPAGTDVLDEHVIAEIPVGDPDYDELFMTAMATARQRQAIFEAEG